MLKRKWNILQNNKKRRKNNKNKNKSKGLERKNKKSFLKNILETGQGMKNQKKGAAEK